MDWPHFLSIYFCCFIFNIMNVSCVKMNIHFKKDICFLNKSHFCYSQRIYLFGQIQAEHGHLLGFTVSCVPLPKKSLLLLFPQHFLPLLKPLARPSQTHGITESRQLDSLCFFVFLLCFWKLCLIMGTKRAVLLHKASHFSFKKSRLISF